MADEYERRMLADIPATRSETGALQFHIHRDRHDRDLFVIYEVWKDVDALRRHFETSYVRRFVSDSGTYIDGDMDVQWLAMSSDYTAGRP
jgi:quinol monooxygenase YgiN